MRYSNQRELTKNDIRYVVERTPRDIRDLLSAHAGKVFMGGGFIRATVAGEVPSDIDLFGHDADYLKNVAQLLSKERSGSRIHESGNALTLLTPGRMTIQFITRWTFKNAHDLVRSFDFTVCQAAIWRAGKQSNAKWMSCCSDGFYIDLAGRRLVYTNPVRDEEAGGSLLRALKYVKRGYSIQVGSLADVVNRLYTAMNDEKRFKDMPPLAALDTLLREVDPSLVIDGLEVVDDHEPMEGVDR